MSHKITNYGMYRVGSSVLTCYLVVFRKEDVWTSAVARLLLEGFHAFNVSLVELVGGLRIRHSVRLESYFNTVEQNRLMVAFLMSCI